MKRLFIAVKNIVFILISPILVIPMNLHMLFTEGTLWAVLSGKKILILYED